MTLDLDDREHELLLDLLKDQLGTLREQVYHSDTPAFKDDLKAREVTLQGVIRKLETRAEAPLGRTG